MKRSMKKIMILLPALLLMLSSNYKITVVSDTVNPFNLSLPYDVTVNIDETQAFINGSFHIHYTGLFKLDIFGDYLKQLKWNVTVLDWEKLLSTPYKEQNITLTVNLAGSQSEYMEYYGLAVITMWINPLNTNDNTTSVHEIYLNIPGGKPWTFPLHNYTGYIIAENIPRDLYLPMKCVQLTAWFRPNVSGIYLMDLYGVFPPVGSWLGWKDVRTCLSAGQTYKLNYTFYPGSWGFSAEWHIRFKKDDGTILEEKVINMTAHCPGHDENYYPFNSYTGNSIADINLDGIVDIFDAVILSGHVGTSAEEENYFERADINGDGIIDLYDAVLLSKDAGETVN